MKCQKNKVRPRYMCEPINVWNQGFSCEPEFLCKPSYYCEPVSLWKPLRACEPLPIWNLWDGCESHNEYKNQGENALAKGVMKTNVTVRLLPLPYMCLKGGKIWKRTERKEKFRFVNSFLHILPPNKQFLYWITIK